MDLDIEDMASIIKDEPEEIIHIENRSDLSPADDVNKVDRVEISGIPFLQDFFGTLIYEQEFFIGDEEVDLTSVNALEDSISKMDIMHQGMVDTDEEDLNFQEIASHSLLSSLNDWRTASEHSEENHHISSDTNLWDGSFHYL